MKPTLNMLACYPMMFFVKHAIYYFWGTFLIIILFKPSQR